MINMNTFENLVNGNVAPVLINKDVEKFIEPYAVILNSNSDNNEIMCTYDNNGERKFPAWYKKLQDRSNDEKNVMLIKSIDDVDDLSQLRFKEILKYKSINSHKLPDNTIIFVSYNNCENINENIKSLLIKFK